MADTSKNEKPAYSIDPALDFKVATVRTLYALRWWDLGSAWVSVFTRVSTSWITSSCLDSLYGFLDNGASSDGPPPRLSSQLPPVLLSKSHLSARGHSLGPPRMWQHHAISKVKHLTAPHKHAAESFTHAQLLKSCMHRKSLSVQSKIFIKNWSYRSIHPLSPLTPLLY